MMNSLRRIMAVLLKEFRQLSRDRVTFAMIVMIPLVQLLLFGFAINSDVRHIEVGLVDKSNSHHTRALIRAVEATQVVNFTQHYASAAAAEAAITRGEVKAILYLPADATTRLLRHPSLASAPVPQAPVPAARPVGQWIVDGSDTMVAGAIRALRMMPLAEVVGKPWQQAVPTFEVVQYFNPEQRTAVNIVPGLLAIILTMTMILFTSAAIVREREQGNMEFLIATPVRPLELMIGKIIPYILVGLIQLFIILGLGHQVFHVPLAGGLGALLVVTLLFILASLVLGLVISTFAQTQLQAMQMTVFILMPSILLSGFMFPYQAMPKLAQHIAEALPATHFMRLIRGVVLRDAAVLDLVPDIIWLTGFSVVGLIIATLRFRKRLD